MNRKQSPYLLPATLGIDLGMIGCAWLCSYYVRFYTVFEVTRGIPEFELYTKLLPFLFMIWILTGLGTGAFTRTMSLNHQGLREIGALLSHAGLTLMGLIVFSYFYEEYRYSRITLLVFAGLLPVFLSLGHALLRGLLYWKRRNQTPKAVLILARASGLSHAVRIARHQEGGHTKIQGIILPGTGDNTEDLALCRSFGLPVIPEPSDWIQYFSEHPTHTLIIALPQSAYGGIEAQLEVMADQVVDVQILPDIARFTRLTPGVDLVDGVPIISLHESPLSGYNLLLKRCFDVAGAVFALLLLSPVMLLIAALVRMSSRGPTFYRQERMSLDGTRFECLKFRSMPVDAESQTGAVWAKAGDARATPLGAFLRRTSLDELPQLINVLRGDMSLVGPRPERPIFVNQFRTQIPGYMLRHKVKTGITGWAQVNGWRGNTSLEKRIECDLFYIQNWTIWLDLKILFLTLDEVIRGRNAY